MSGDRASIFRDIFHGGAEGSIREVGGVATAQIPELQAFSKGLNRNEVDFEAAVQGWLTHLQDRLIHGFARANDPVFAEHVMPALGLGEIRAGGPRAPRRATG